MILKCKKEILIPPSQIITVLIKKETVELNGVSVTRVTFNVGAKWSKDLKDYAGTHSCQLPHVALVLAGTLRVAMDDGSIEDFSKNDVDVAAARP